MQCALGLEPIQILGTILQAPTICHINSVQRKTQHLKFSKIGWNWDAQPQSCVHMIP